MKILVSVNSARYSAYTQELQGLIERHKLDATLATDTDTPSEIDVIVYEPTSPIQDFTAFTNLKLVQSIWAGVDSIIGNKTFSCPLSRMVDLGLIEGMREYVLGHILNDHLAISKFQTLQKNKTWDDSDWLPLARNVNVGIVGAGNLGTAVGVACQTLGFHVHGWASSQKSLPFASYYGHDTLFEMLGKCDYVVTLLPHTKETADIVNVEFLEAMKPTAMLINPGRGALVDEDDLIKALDEGVIRKVALDVFKTEPLPQIHPFWSRPDILITPHIAAKSRVDTACEMIIENLMRLDRGDELLHVVDRQKGY